MFGDCSGRRGKVFKHYLYAYLGRHPVDTSVSEPFPQRTPWGTAGTTALKSRLRCSVMLMSLSTQCYCETLQNVHHAIKTVHPFLLIDGDVMLHNMSLCSPCCLGHCSAFTEGVGSFAIHPRLVSIWNHSFPLSREKLKGHRFWLEEDGRIVVVQWFKHQPKENFHRCDSLVDAALMSLFHCPWGLFVTTSTPSIRTILKLFWFEHASYN
jgi:hypothetical protein